MTASRLTLESPAPSTELIGLGPALAVVAHPDDESFGLGAVLATLTAAGMDVRVLCLTHGEATTLGTASDHLGNQRAAELYRAAEELGITSVVLRGLPDGALSDVAPAKLDAIVDSVLADARLLVVFEPGGVTGHPDHRAATASARRIALRRRLAVLEWGVSREVASTLNAELGTSFVALERRGAFDIDVDRRAQLEAIACHDSQARDNPVLARRIELTGSKERLRLSRRHGRAM